MPFRWSLITLNINQESVTNMHKKYFIIIIAAISFLVVLATAYFVYSYFANRPKLDSVTKRGHIATQKKITFDYNNNKIVMNDFLDYPVRTLDGGVLYLADTLDYGITYWPANKEFRIAVLLTPVKDKSLAAEKEFLNVLGISAEQACKLNVKVVGHYSVDDQFLNDAEYAPSFCSGKHLK